MCVCVRVCHLLDKLLDGSERQRERERELTSTGRAALRLCGCVTPPSAMSSGCRRGRFTAGWLLRNEPQEASQRSARGISTIINNQVFWGEKVSAFSKQSCLCGALQEAPSIISKITKAVKREEGYDQNLCRDSVWCTSLQN